MLRYAHSAIRDNKIKRAVELLSELAESGHPEGQMEFGRLYFEGIGVDKDSERGFYWTLMAAQRDYPAAQSLLGSLYETGQGVGQNDKQSHIWYLKAAEHGELEAQYKAGRNFLEGKGVEPDTEAALKWLFQAADKNHDLAQLAYGRELLKTDANIKAGWSWIDRAIGQDNGDAMMLLARSFEEGTHGKKLDIIKARQYYKQAAEVGHPEGQLKFGEMLRDGIGGPEDHISAYMWFTRAGEIARLPLKRLEKMMSQKNIRQALHRLNEAAHR